VGGGILGSCLLGVEQDGDFAVLLDGNGEIGGVVVIEVARGYAVATLELDVSFRCIARPKVPSPLP